MSEKKFSVADLTHIIARYFWVILLSTIIGIGCAFIIRPSGNQPQVATAQVMVSPDKDYDISNGTLVDLVKTDQVLGEAVRTYNKSVKKPEQRVEYNDLFNSLQVTVTGSSRIVTIAAEEGDSSDSVRLVNAIANQMAKISNEQLPVYKVKVVSQATLISTDAGFSLKKAIAVGGAAGIFVGLVLAFILNYVTRKKTD